MTPATKTILICDDDQGMRDTIAAILGRDYRVLTVSSGEAALALLRQEEVDVMLQDVRLPGISGFDVLRIVKENYSLVECIMISAINEVETAVQAMKHGAYHYITKNFDYDELRSLVRNACERQDLNRQVMTLSAQVAEQSDREFHIGPSKQVREIVELVHKVAKLSATVLILGESGTGKELLARLLHKESGRRRGAVHRRQHVGDPARAGREHALRPRTRRVHRRHEAAAREVRAGGRAARLFLDEIGDLRLDLQAKLLRAIQEGEIERVGGAKPIRTNFRLVVATNVDLEKAVRDGRFREDLYYRINVIPIRMPPLRERIEDLPELARLFLERYRVKFRKPVRGLSDSALKILASYWWPGNIRELENLIERLVAVSDTELITDEDLPLEYHFAKLDSGPATGGALFQEACDTFERNFILRALEKKDWNVTATARYLGIPLSTLKHKMARLDLTGLAKKLRNA